MRVVSWRRRWRRRRRRWMWRVMVYGMRRIHSSAVRCRVSIRCVRGRRSRILWVGIWPWRISSIDWRRTRLLSSCWCYRRLLQATSTSVGRLGDSILSCCRSRPTLRTQRRSRRTLRIHHVDIYDTSRAGFEEVLVPLHNHGSNPSLAFLIRFLGPILAVTLNLRSHLTR